MVIFDGGELDIRARKTNHILRPPKVFNPPPVKNRKRPLSLIKLLIFLLFLALLVWFIFKSPFLAIRNIIIDSDLPGTVAQTADQFKGQNIVLVKSSKIKDILLESNPELSNIKVMRGLPNSIRISVEERKSSIIWETSGKRYLVDEDGLIYKEIQGETDLPLVKDNNNLQVQTGSQVVTANFISFVDQLRSKLAQTNLKIDHFEVNETTFQVNAVTDQGLILKFDTIGSAEAQVNDLVVFWNDHSTEPKSYVDLRVEGKVFYK